MKTHTLNQSLSSISTCLGLATILLVTNSAQLASARLGGFEAEDGYIDVERQITFDVGQYNAGINPGGTWMFSAYPEGSDNPDGLGWKKLPGSPRIPHGSTAPGNVYATSHSANTFQGVSPRTGERSLMITTNNQGWDGDPQRYSYQIDADDLLDQEGMNVQPFEHTDSIVKIDFWSCAQLLGTDETSIPGLAGGLSAGARGNTVSFLDSLGQGGVKVGYVQPGTTTDNFAYDIGNGWVDTDLEVDPRGWHKWEVTLDMASDLVTIALQPAEGADLVTLVSRQSMAPMSGYFKEMIFSSTGGPDNTNPATVSGKLWTLDEFSITAVPEPNAGILMFFATMGMLVFRRRSV
ncbi:MAG: PEP-CTERM sorting domain-containing protein [Planctomycetota bacterium]